MDQSAEHKSCQDLPAIAMQANVIYSCEALIKHYWRRETGL
jgi:hypothetical protein